MVELIGYQPDKHFMASYLSYVVDHLGRLWELKNDQWSIVETVPLRPRSPVVMNYTITDEGYLFDVTKHRVKEIPGLLEQPKIKSLNSSYDGNILLIVTQDNIGLMYHVELGQYQEGEDQLVGDPIENVAYFAALRQELRERAIDSTIVIETDGRIRVTSYVNDNISASEIVQYNQRDLIIPLDDVIRVHHQAIFLRDRMIDVGSIIYDCDESRAIKESSFQAVNVGITTEDCDMGDMRDIFIILDSNGDLHTLDDEGSLFNLGNAMSDELDDRSQWVELIDLDMMGYVGVVNRSGKAYRINKEAEIGRLNLPREVFYQTHNKNPRTKL